jgi:hypothetical protein
MPEEVFQSLAAREANISLLRITDTDPEQVFLNSTASDADEARASIIRGRGTQSGGEQTTLGIIGFSHDGTSDDQKGVISFKVNAGTQGESPTDRVTIANNITTINTTLDMADNLAIRLGTGQVTQLAYSSTQATLVWGLDNTNNSLVLTKLANFSKNHDHGANTDSTLFIHSATDPDSDNTEWISFTHNQTDGVIDCGKGTLNLGATGNVNFAGAAHTGTGDTATNGYVTMEVAGASIKFATVA